MEGGREGGRREGGREGVNERVRPVCPLGRPTLGTGDRKQEQTYIVVYNTSLSVQRPQIGTKPSSKPIQIELGPDSTLPHCCQTCEGIGKLRLMVAKEDG